MLASCELHRSSAAVAGTSGWNSSPNTQYHIQTDEGDERYFRYQTTSGQYRKEKRLEDGTVIGTSGWVDPNGMLRLSDYIADNKGYRILRNKMVYVGLNEDVGKGVAKAKHVPATSGELVDQSVLPPTVLKTVVESSTANPFYNPSTVTPIAVTAKPFYNPSTVTPIAVYSSTPATVESYQGKIDTSYQYPKPDASFNAVGVLYPDQIEALPEKRFNPYTNLYATSQNRPAYPLSEPARTYDAPATAIPFQYRAPVGNYRDFGQKTPYVNNYDHPIRSKYEAFGNSLGPQVPEGYGSKLPSYDGISTTKDGFRYYLPRQYHEEISSSSGETRTGSFGYIDPFGIRRVTYYNTNPGSGFIHRKNNRYVGFGSTPYDPRF